MRSSFLPITRFTADVLPNYLGMPPLKMSQQLYRLLCGDLGLSSIQCTEPKNKGRAQGIIVTCEKP